MCESFTVNAENIKMTHSFPEVHMMLFSHHTWETSNMLSLD